MEKTPTLNKLKKLTILPDSNAALHRIIRCLQLL